MTNYRWFKCTLAACRCRLAGPTSRRTAPTTLQEVAMDAVIGTVNDRHGRAPGLTSAEERSLIAAVTARLGEVLEGDLIAACPWHVAREEVVGFQVRRFPRLPEPRAGRGPARRPAAAA